MTPRFLVVSGLPGSGKTTLATRLAAALTLPLLDKDDILETLFETAGPVDPPLRQRLSRASDDLLRQRAAASPGAVLVSFWRHPGMGGTAGTPIDWLERLIPTPLEIYCTCPPEIAAQRFRTRTRHPSHNDALRLAGLADQFQALATLGALGRFPCITVPTDQPCDIAALLARIRHPAPPDARH